MRPRLLKIVVAGMSLGACTPGAAFMPTRHVGHWSPTEPGCAAVDGMARRHPNRRRSERMCICINCKWVTSCKAYHFVETKHEQPHMSAEPAFMPRDGSPTITVTIRTEQKSTLWKDLPGPGEYEPGPGHGHEHENEHEHEHEHEHDLAGTAASATHESAKEDADATGETAAAVAVAAGNGGGFEGVGAGAIADQRDAPEYAGEVVTMAGQVTTEYDVIKCADFVEDRGCWVRNMPEEIKRMNPEFVPT
eukprot:CAMPEP_0182561196 /NCGR_PEP_ID=MMETSP1324-20130603/3722_1 /TAXON_ID=236786 /ORGANISM="Florenciella sp., Strain RCC1587" /LENGTH=248 /DNA_ID=CAMNT_0024773743 /DNA_START=123 /DNA_END=869 /DNA_ORIENTATION=-